MCIRGRRDRRDDLDRDSVKQAQGLGGPPPQWIQPTAESIGCGSSGGTSRCLWEDVLGVAGLVDAVTFLGEVVAPVVVEVAVAGDGAQFEDGLCAGEPPSGAGEIHP